MTSVAIQVLPSAENDQELCRIVDEVIAYIAGTGLRYEVGPFETTIEGDDYDQLILSRNASTWQSAQGRRRCPLM